MVGPRKRKINIGDVIFGTLLVGMLLFMIPFYSSIIDIIMLSAQFMVGSDTYVCILGFLFCVFLIFLGIKYKNNATKIFALILGFAFIMSPFWGYLKERKYFDRTFSTYHFKGITVVLPDTCGVAQKAEEQLANKLEEEYGEDMHIDVDKIPMPIKNSTFQEKLKCMPTKTQYAYLIEYKDANGQSRVITYDGEDTFDSHMAVSSYEIMYTNIGDFFSQKQPDRKVEYHFYFYDKQDGLKEMTRGNLVEKKISFVYPSLLTLQNFNQDNRLVLDVTFSILVHQEEAHQMIEELDQNSIYPLHAVIHYGKTTEYYADQKWYGKETDFFKKIEGK